MASVQKPKKGILKTSSSFDKVDHHHGKEMKWDEMNILATHHPPDKDYGHIKIDEPPTPYSKYSDQEDEEGDNLERRGSFGAADDLDPSSIASKLEGIEEKEGHRIRRVSTTDESSEEDELTEEEKAKKRNFEQKRKLHYNEFQAVKLAKQLMEEEDDDDDDENDNDEKTNDNDNGNDNEKDNDAMQTDSADPDVNKNVGISPALAESSSGTSSSSTTQSADSTKRIERETEIF